MKVITTTLFGAVRPHQRRIHRVHGQVGHQRVHGSGYEYFADDAFNANAASSPSQDATSNNNFGSTLGGPVEIQEYDGRNKTFFFVNFDYTRLRSGVLPGFGNTTPIDAFKSWRLQRAADGHPDRHRRARAADFAGQIFNPATTRLVNGIPVRDPYPGNMIPADDPLRSPVAARSPP